MGVHAPPQALAVVAAVVLPLAGLAGLHVRDRLAVRQEMHRVNASLGLAGDPPLFLHPGGGGLPSLYYKQALGTHIRPGMARREVEEFVLRAGAPSTSAGRPPHLVVYRLGGGPLSRGDAVYVHVGYAADDTVGGWGVDNS